MDSSCPQTKELNLLWPSQAWVAEALREVIFTGPLSKAIFFFFFCLVLLFPLTRITVLLSSTVLLSLLQYTLAGSSACSSHRHTELPQPRNTFKRFMGVILYHLHVLAVELIPLSFLQWPSLEEGACTGLGQWNCITQPRAHQCTGTSTPVPGVSPGTMSCVISDTVRVPDRSWPWHQTPHKMEEAKTCAVRSQPNQGHEMLSKAMRAPFPRSEHISRASRCSVCSPWKGTAPFGIGNTALWLAQRLGQKWSHLGSQQTFSLPIEGGRKLKEKLRVLQFHHWSTKPSACDCDRNKFWQSHQVTVPPFFLKPI